MSPSKGSIFCHGKYTRTWHLQKLICCRNITTIQRKYWQKNQHATETLPAIQSTLGPGLAVGEKGKNRGQIGKISASEASWAVSWGRGMSGGAVSHAFDAAVPWYQILVSSSDWSSVFVLTDSRCCWQYRALSISRCYNSGKDFLKHGFRESNTNFFARLFTYPSAPRRAKNICLWSVAKRKISIQNIDLFLDYPVINYGNIYKAIVSKPTFKRCSIVITLLLKAW